MTVQQIEYSIAYVDVIKIVVAVLQHISPPLPIVQICCRGCTTVLDRCIAEAFLKVDNLMLTQLIRCGSAST